MPLTSLPLRILSIGDPDPVQEQIVTALSTQKEFELAGVINRKEMIVREVRSVEPDIILVNPTLEQQPTLDIIDDLNMQFPDAAIIAILPSSDPVLGQQVNLAGARAYLIQPFTQINLLATLRRVRDLQERHNHFQATGSPGVQESNPLHTIAVYSPRGGAGCSTIATNLAMSLHETTEHRVLLLEGKLFFGHLDVMLNIRAHNTLADLIPHANNMDENLVREVVIKHSSGLNVLLSPSSVQVSQGIRPDDLYNMLTGIQKLYDIIVIDAGSYLSENTVTLLDSSDRILLLTTPDMASLHDISRFIQVSRSLAYPADKLLLTLNRSGAAGSIKNDDIESALHMSIYTHIPNDGANAIRSLNRGIPLVTRYPRSPASKAIRRLAGILPGIMLSGTGSRSSSRRNETNRREPALASGRSA